MSQVISTDLYDLLGLQRGATDVQVRRAYKKLLTKSHPDKGGDAEHFASIQKAYKVLSTPEQKRIYDETGKVDQSAEEHFAETFGNGSFKAPNLQSVHTTPLSEQITVQQAATEQSHTAGFDAWMRTRGEQGTSVFTADTVAETLGIVEGSYNAVPLPSLDVFQVTCNTAGPVKKVTKVSSAPSATHLNWGEVLVSMQYAPINPADAYTIATGGMYGDDQVQPPFLCGHDGVGTVTKVGQGVKGLAEGDWVVPAKVHMGSWRNAAVWKGSDLLKLPETCLPAQYAAVWRELCLAYRLLEDHGGLKPGDCVILNAANSTVGQLVLQLCRLLHLRSIAVIRQREQAQQDFEQTSAWLKTLGADVVLEDFGSLKAELDKHKFFAKPKLALDCVGGPSSVRLSDALAQGGQLVIYGCMSGKAPMWPWHSWVFHDMQVAGFNLRKWMAKNSKKVGKMLEALGQLVAADKLKLEYTEYEFPSEFTEALDHALSNGKDTKVLLRMTATSIDTSEGP